LVHIQIEEIISYNINMSKNKNSISNNKVSITIFIKYLVLNYENFTKINTRILQK